MASPTDAGRHGGPNPASLVTGAFLLLAVGLAVALWCMPDHVDAGWVVFGTVTTGAALAGLWIHPPSYRAPLAWGVCTLGCALAAQLCALAGVRPDRQTGVTLFDLFLLAACVCAIGALFDVIARRVPGWDPGFLLDVTIVVAAVAATVWLYILDPELVTGTPSLFRRLTLTGYPAFCSVLAVLSVMLLIRVGLRRRGIALTVLGVAGLIYTCMFLLIARLDDPSEHGFWADAAVAGLGLLVLQACWSVGPLHAPNPQCPSAAGRSPRRPVTLTRLLLLLSVALANPVVLNVQIARGRVPPLGHFPVVGGAVLLAVIMRLVFIGVEHMRSVQRLNTLLAAQPRISGAQTPAELVQATAEVAGSLLEGRGEVYAALLSADRLETADWNPARPQARFDPSRLRTMITEWPWTAAEAAPGLRFLDSTEYSHQGAASALALACPVVTARSQRTGKPLGALVVVGSSRRVAGAANLLALLAAQVGESLERIGVTRRTARRHLKAMTANIADAILVIDEDEIVRYSNAAAQALFGGRAQPGTGLAELVGPDRAEALAAPTDERLLRWSLSGGAQIVEAQVDDRRADPTVEGVVLTLRDVTKLHTVEQELRRRATHDPETGLENRLAFTAHLAETGADGGDGDGVQHGVLAVAVDDLPEITEESGSATAHRVLAELARRLGAAFDGGHPHPAVARIDASTLALLISGAPELPPPDELLARVRAAGAEPLALDDRAVTASISAGFAAEQGRGPAEEMLEDALLALHAAQRNSPRGLAAYTPALRETSRGQAEMRAGLNAALLEGRFSLRYQPVVDLASRGPISAEALVRWRKPDGSWIRPDLFIPFAEQTGQIVPLGAWVLRQAVEDYRRWPQLTDGAGDPGHLRVNVNVSPVQLREPDFLAQVRALLTETGLSPSSLVLEVTESGIVEQVETLVQARALGIGVAMDDFGTGYSSLSSLRRLPITTVKIDKAFVDGIATDPVQFALVEGIVRLAGELGLTTVAEGVEDEEQHTRLRAAGCQCGQGYLYSRPLTAEDFEQWLLTATVE
jgi:EAL domain-containing protein (putative c-di-GMP-specific phosphodiesterase class I)/GGDEF domain-containing protein